MIVEYIQHYKHLHHIHHVRRLPERSSFDTSWNLARVAQMMIVFYIILVYLT